MRTSCAASCWCESPLIFALLLAVGPIFAKDTALTGNIFALEDPVGYILVVAAAMALAWSCGQAWWLVLRYAHLRFDVAEWTAHDSFLKPVALGKKNVGKGAATEWRKTGPPLLFFFGLTLPLNIVLWQCSTISALEKLLSFVGGLALGITFVSVVEAVRVAITNWTSTWGAKLGTWPDAVKAGYYNEEDASFLRGHLAAAAALIVLLAVYLLLPPVFSPAESFGDAIPMLAYVFWMLITLNTLFSGIAFFLDRFRVPLLLGLIGVSLLSRVGDAGDHYFPLRDPTDGQLPPAAAGTAFKERAKNGRAIVVCAAGGGIQAAGWTATVLTGLDQELEQDGWRDAVALISGVSGGGVGAMYYVEQLHRGKLDETGRKDVRTAAMASSLSAVGWGFVFHDMRRLLLVRSPWSRDRGWALEQAWRRMIDPKLVSTMGDWSVAAAEGKLPGVIFNATIADDGRRMLFGTVQIAGRLNFFEKYQKDIDVATAARLAATFPYVSPLARASIGGEPSDAHKWYLADGGYFDNLGIVTAADWICETAAQFKHVAIVMISPFPGVSPELEPSKTGVWAKLSRAWFGPLGVVLGARTATQTVRAEVEAHLLQRAAKPTVEIVHFVVPAAQEPDPTSPPLSWHLTTTQKKNIANAWANDSANKKSVEQLRKWLNDPKTRGP